LSSNYKAHTEINTTQTTMWEPWHNKASRFGWTRYELVMAWDHCRSSLQHTCSVQYSAESEHQ